MKKFLFVILGSLGCLPAVPQDAPQGTIEVFLCDIYEGYLGSIFMPEKQLEKAVEASNASAEYLRDPNLRPIILTDSDHVAYRPEPQPFKLCKSATEALVRSLAIDAGLEEDPVCLVEFSAPFECMGKMYMFCEALGYTETLATVPNVFLPIGRKISVDLER